ncbi:MAG: glycosyltransferase [Alkalibacterium sp.]|nr:glycosyltransferase [Alkalibacterium sp.]
MLYRRNYQTLFITGKDHYQSIMDKWIVPSEDADLNAENVKVVPYINNLPEVFASVSLVVARSGATTLSELTSLGVPSILIPSPNVTEDHQTKNAVSLENKEAALVLKETDLDAESLMNKIDLLMNDQTQREKMSKASRGLGKPNASDLIIKTILELVKR